MGVARHSRITVASGIVLALLVVAGPLGAAGDPVVLTASISRSEVGVGETLRLTIAVSVPDRRQMEHLELPDTGSLGVIGTHQEVSTRLQFDGSDTQFQRFENTILSLRATREGETLIGPASLRYAGKVYRTEPIRVRVTKVAPQRRRPAGPVSPFGGARSPLWPDDDFFRSPFDDLVRAPEPIAGDDMFLRAELVPDQVVEGQQVTVSLMIYSRVGARIAAIRWPKLEDFFSVDRDVSNAKTGEKVIGGEMFQYKLLDRNALFPLRPGEFTIEPIEVDVEASSSPFFPAESKTLRTKSLKLRVEPLPAAGRPADFSSGNVGRFSLQADVDSRSVALNQPVTFTLMIRGTGAIQRLRPPELDEVDGFKVFEPTIDVKTNKKGQDVTGSKTFEYVLLPLSSGTLTIPSLSLTAFDPVAAEYRTSSTDPIPIAVTASGAQADGDRVPVGREVNIVSGAFKPVRFESDLAPYGPPLYRRAWFLPLVVCPPLLYLLVLLAAAIRTGLQTSSPRARARRAQASARRRLRLAARTAERGQAADCFAEVKAALLEAAEARLGLPVGGMPASELHSRLVETGFPEQQVMALAGEVENCDFGRFAPAAARSGEMQAALERAGRLVRALARTSHRRPAAPRRARR